MKNLLDASEKVAFGDFGGGVGGLGHRGVPFVVVECIILNKI
jgi:hypothetical protein